MPNDTDRALERERYPWADEDTHDLVEHLTQWGYGHNLPAEFIADVQSALLIALRERPRTVH